MALTPVATLTHRSAQTGPPGGANVIAGFLTFGAADTYVAGGLVLAPGAIGLNVKIVAISIAGITIVNANGTVSLTFQTQMQGAGVVAATTTTATVTVAAATGNNALTANTPILAQLNDAATAGGGAGTWAASVAVASVKFASATTFTITTTAAAPTNGGNFVWTIPTLSMEMAAGTPLANTVLPFVAIGV